MYCASAQQCCLLTMHAGSLDVLSASYFDCWPHSCGAWLGGIKVWFASSCDGFQSSISRLLVLSMDDWCLYFLVLSMDTELVSKQGNLGNNYHPPWVCYCVSLILMRILSCRLLDKLCCWSSNLTMLWHHCVGYRMTRIQHHQFMYLIYLIYLEIHVDNLPSLFAWSGTTDSEAHRCEVVHHHGM